MIRVFPYFLILFTNICLSQTFNKIDENVDVMGFYTLEQNDSIFLLGVDIDSQGNWNYFHKTYNVLGDEIDSDLLMSSPNNLSGPMLNRIRGELFWNSEVNGAVDNIIYDIDISNGFQFDTVPKAFSHDYGFHNVPPKKFRDSLTVLPYCEFYTPASPITFSRALVIDGFGNKVGLNDFSRGNHEFINGVQSLWNGNTMISFFRFYGEQFNFWDADIAIFDHLNEPVSNNRYNTFDNSGINTILELSDKTYLLFESYFQNNLSKTKIIKVDVDGVELDSWYLDNFTVASHKNTDHSLELQDGSILITLLDKSPFGFKIPNVLRINPFGDLMWNKTFSYNDSVDQQFLGMDTITGGGYLFGGHTRDLVNNKQCAWLVRTDCHGEIDASSTEPCPYFNCTQYPIDASFTCSDTLIDLATQSGEVDFSNSSPFQTSRIWSFGEPGSFSSSADPKFTYTTPGDYIVNLDVYVGKCTSTFKRKITVINSDLSLEEVQADDVDLYPNPAKNVLNIDTKASVNNIQIWDTNGKPMHCSIQSKEKNKFKIEAQNLSRGVYFISLQYETGQELHLKFVRE